jgi:hypothetical protein
VLLVRRHILSSVGPGHTPPSSSGAYPCGSIMEKPYFAEIERKFLAA